MSVPNKPSSCFDPMPWDCYGISLSMRLCRLWHIDISDDCRLLPSSSLSWESWTYTYVKFDIDTISRHSSSISSMTPINSMVAMCYIFKSRVIWKSLKLSNTLLFTTRSQEVVILEDECWFISVSRLHLPLQLVLDMVVSAVLCIKDQPSIYLCLQCALMKVERWCWCIIMSNHFCHTLLRSSYCWLCVLHRESRVNPISNKRCLLCISIVGLPEEQTLEIDTICGIYMSSFHFSSSSELPNNSLPLPLWQSTSFHPSWPLIVVCLLWESRVIQYPMESYHSAKHIIPLLIVVCSTEKRESIH